MPYCKRSNQKKNDKINPAEERLGQWPLLPDMQKIWARVLKLLRENNEYVLHTACQELNNIEFSNQQIIINCHDTAMFSLFTKYLPLLIKYAGSDCIVVKQINGNKTKHNKSDTLKKLFNEKVKLY